LTFDRRAADRPANGDTRTCPWCVAGVLEFNERWRGGSTPASPGWACDACRHQVLVRSARMPIVDPIERALSERGLFDALRLLNITTDYRFTGVYRFEAGAAELVRSVTLFDRKNPHLCIGEDVAWLDSYCRMTARDGESCWIDSALTDVRLRTHTARAAVQSYIGVLLRLSSGAPLGTLCHFDVRPRRTEERTIRDLRAVRGCIERALEAALPVRSDHPHDAVSDVVTTAGPVAATSVSNGER
jgi:hypothetical protein